MPRQGKELPKQLLVYRMEEDAYATVCRELLARLEADQAHRKQAADVSEDTSAACFMTAAGAKTS